MNRVKLSSLKVVQLNKLLQNQNISVVGNRAAKLAKLAEIYPGDEIDVDEVEDDGEHTGARREMDELRGMILQLTKTVSDLVASRERPGASASAAQETVRISSTPSNESDFGNATRATGVAVHSRTSNLREIYALMPEYDPLKNNVSSEVFVEKVVQLRRAYELSEQETLVAAQSKLKGVAKEWLDSQTVFQTWSDFVQAFQLDFPASVTSAQMHRNMAQRKRQPKESFEEYYYIMLSIGRRGRMDEESINSYIIAGLNDPSLTRTLLALKLPTCNDLLRSLKDMADAPGPSKARMMYEKGNNDKNSGSTNERKLKCYNCNQYGHIASKCQQPQRKQKCTKCNKVGHDAQACRNGKPNVAKLMDDSKRVISTASKDVTWNGKQLRSLLDTGSDVSLVAASKVPNDMPRFPSTKRLQGFGGAVITSNEFVEAELVIDGITILTPCYIVADKFMTHDIVIGWDVLCKESFRLIIESGVMKVYQQRELSFNVNEDMSGIDLQEVRCVLQRYESCFTEDLSDLGRCKTTEMEIIINSDQPVIGRQYQVPLYQRPTLSKIVNELLERGIIRPSSSVHAAPVILVKKSNGEDRMCVDYRALNAVTAKKHFPMPIVEEQLSKLVGSTVFTTLDMTAGYYQIPLTEGSKHYTAFLTPDGLFEHNVMPFGLRNAPMVFQEMVTKLIRGLKHRNRIVSYVDEVIIATKSVAQNIEVLVEFLQAVKESGLTLRPSKCNFMATRIQFLGHIVSEEGIQPGEEKTKCIKEFPQPRTTTEVRQFLGLTGYFRKFVEGYSIIAKPLASLLKVNAKYQWSKEQEESFTKLKDILITQPVLVVFDPMKNHEVHTDASAIGVSGILLQSDNKNWKPVQYYSRQCSAAESQYPSHELEVLAIVESLERFRVYLLGTTFVVRTDCNAVVTTKKVTPLRPRIARWWLRLQEFDFSCEHRPGTKMQHVDTLSRLPVERPSCPSTVADKVLSISKTMGPEDWVSTIQLQDKKIRRICALIKGEEETDEDELKQLKEDYAMRNSRLFRKVEEHYKLVVPQSVRWRVVKASHDDAGHFALEKTLDRLRKHFWFPRMRRYVKSYIAACEECCLNKVKGGKRESELHVADVLPIPFRRLHIDHVGPFPRSKSGNVYVLVIVCGFSKYVLLKAVRNTKSEPVIKALEEVMAIFGQPLRVTSDRGTAFTSKLFESFLNQKGIQHVKTAIRTPRANGQVERANKTLLNALRCTVENNKVWDESLMAIQWSINSQKNEVTKYSPNELVFYFDPRDVSHNRMIQAMHDEVVHVSDMEEKRDIAASNIMTERNKWKERYDKRHQKPHKYEVGDLVVIDNVFTATGESHKLDPMYKGPYQVTKVLNYDRYIVEDLPDTMVTQHRYCNVLSADHLKPWCANSPELDIHDDEEDSSWNDEESGEAELSTTEES